MDVTNPALAAALAKANVKTGPAFTGEFEEYCSTWMVATITDDNTPEVKISDLGEDHTYRFRVKAVNSAGPSWPSEPTDEIICKVNSLLSNMQATMLYKNVKPRLFSFSLQIKKQRPIINKDNLNSIKVSKGATITLNAKVQGEPAPIKAWYYGRIEIKPCPSVEIIEKEHSIKLIMTNARRDDTGIYTLKADNEHGQDQADVDVVVMVEPSKPKGPLKVDDIYAEGCSCEWGPPEDDGGTPVTHYLVLKAEGSSMTWAVCGKANGDSTKCKITGLKPEKEHRLQVNSALLLSIICSQ
jgi:hypothetical protein